MVLLNVIIFIFSNAVFLLHYYFSFFYVHLPVHLRATIGLYCARTCTHQSLYKVHQFRCLLHKWLISQSQQQLNAFRHPEVLKTTF